MLRPELSSHELPPSFLRIQFFSRQKDRYQHVGLDKLYPVICSSWRSDTAVKTYISCSVFFECSVPFRKIMTPIKHLLVGWVEYRKLKSTERQARVVSDHARVTRAREDSCATYRTREVGQLCSDPSAITPPSYSINYSCDM